MKPVSIQLYTLREYTKDDFVGILKKVAEMGYAGVEPAGLFGNDPKDVKRIVEDLGMVVSSNHQPWPNRDNLSEVIDVAGGLETRTVICGWGPDQFEDLSAIKKTAEEARFIVEKLTAAGLTVALHNHYWEFERIDGELKYDIFVEQVPDLKLEIDTYWSTNFGANDAAKIVSKWKHRAPLLHIKDGTFVKEAHQVPVGQGKMDIGAVIEAADPNVLEWLIIENDTCDRDMLTCADEGLQYLIENGLGTGGHERT